MNGWRTRFINQPHQSARIKAMSAENKRFWELFHQRRQAAGHPARRASSTAPGRDLVTS